MSEHLDLAAYAHSLAEGDYIAAQIMRARDILQTEQEDHAQNIAGEIDERHALEFATGMQVAFLRFRQRLSYAKLGWKTEGVPSGRWLLTTWAERTEVTRLMLDMEHIMLHDALDEQGESLTDAARAGLTELATIYLRMKELRGHQAAYCRRRLADVYGDPWWPKMQNLWQWLAAQK